METETCNKINVEDREGQQEIKNRKHATLTRCFLHSLMFKPVSDLERISDFSLSIKAIFFQAFFMLLFLFITINEAFSFRQIVNIIDSVYETIMLCILGSIFYILSLLSIIFIINLLKSYILYLIIVRMTLGKKDLFRKFFNVTIFSDTYNFLISLVTLLSNPHDCVIFSNFQTSIVETILKHFFEDLKLNEDPKFAAVYNRINNGLILLKESQISNRKVILIFNFLRYLKISTFFIILVVNMKKLKN